MIKGSFLISLMLLIVICLEAQVKPATYFVYYKVLIKKITADDEYFTQNERNPEFYSDWIEQWKNLVTSLSADTTNVQAWLQYKNQTHVALNLLIQIETQQQPIRAAKYYDFLSVVERMDLFEIQYYTDISISNANKAINNNLVNFRRKLSNQLDSLDSISQLRLQAVDSAVNRKIDSLISMSNGPIFAGPSLYVENIYGFNFFFSIDSLSDVKLSRTIGKKLKLAHARLTMMSEVLFFSDGVDRRFGGSLYLGYSFWEGKIIPQVMVQYLDDKRRLETSSGNNFNMGFGVLFKNREWMLGFSYSPISGGGIKLLIGL